MILHFNFKDSCRYNKAEILSKLFSENFLTTLLSNGDDGLTWTRTVSLGGVWEVMECSDLVNKEVLMRRGEWRDWEDVIRVK